LLKRLVDDGHAMQEGQSRRTKYRYAGRGHADEDTIC
jgi:hypothetical protein